LKQPLHGWPPLRRWGSLRSWAPFRRWAALPIIALIVVALDQVTKSWIEANIPLGGSLAPWPALAPYFRLVHLTNTGAAFGLLRGQGSLFAVIAAVVIVAVLVYARYLPADNQFVRLCLGLQLGGAAGNLIDRLQHGQVTDFLLFSLPVRGRVLEWPSFNVADSCIVIGVAVLAFFLLRNERTEVSSPTAPAGDPLADNTAIADPSGDKP
jgi:signal peptidase II